VAAINPNHPLAQMPLPPSMKNCIQLAACEANELLPMNPDLPADLFTSCLTTPIKIALRWFCMQKSAKLVPGVTLDLIEKIPGRLNDRRTPLGELNWIFTAITDTIAWNVLPRDLFQKLFRQDLLVASLFRNFLLAERIMRSYNCTPVSSPRLPPTYMHAMWQAWDLAVDICLSQLPTIIEEGTAFRHSPFFAEQLTAFQVWLTMGVENRNPPEQLPIVLQVLLSQVHRLRALDLLGRFLDLGPWAVSLTPETTPGVCVEDYGAGGVSVLMHGDRPAQIQLPDPSLSDSPPPDSSLTDSSLTDSSLTDSSLTDPPTPPPPPDSSLTISSLTDYSLPISSLPISSLMISSPPISSLTDSSLTDSSLTISSLMISSLTDSFLTDSFLTISSLPISSLPISSLMDSSPPDSSLTDSSLADSSLTYSSLTDSSLPISSLTISSVTDSSLTDSSLTDSSPPISSLPISSLTDSSLPISSLTNSSLTNSSLTDSSLPDSSYAGPSLCLRVRVLFSAVGVIGFGPWSFPHSRILTALSVGIFPYVLKLLQSSARELRPLLVFIWAKILAVDSSCQADLVKDNGHKYFLSVLADPYMPAEHRTMAVFILAVIVNNYNTGQEACLQGNLIAICLEQLSDPHPLSCAKLGGRGHLPSASGSGRTVRCAAVFALGTFVGNSAERTDHSTTIDHNVAMMLAQLINDGSPVVRKELVVALSHLVVQYESNFCTVALQFMEEEKNYAAPSPANTTGTHAVKQSGNLTPLRESPAIPRLRSVNSYTNIRAATTARNLNKSLQNLNLNEEGGPVTFSPGNLSASSSASSTLGSPDNDEYILSFETIDKMRRVSSYSSLNSLIGVSFNSVYTQIWRVLLHLAADPFPEVSDLAMKVLNSIAYKDGEGENDGEGGDGEDDSEGGDDEDAGEGDGEEDDVCKGEEDGDGEEDGEEEGEGVGEDVCAGGEGDGEDNSEGGDGEGVGEGEDVCAGGDGDVEDDGEGGDGDGEGVGEGEDDSEGGDGDVEDDGEGVGEGVGEDDSEAGDGDVEDDGEGVGEDNSEGGDGEEDGEGEDDSEGGDGDVEDDGEGGDGDGEEDGEGVGEDDSEGGDGDVEDDGEGVGEDDSEAGDGDVEDEDGEGDGGVGEGDGEGEDDSEGDDGEGICEGENGEGEGEGGVVEGDGEGEVEDEGGKMFVRVLVRATVNARPQKILDSGSLTQSAPASPTSKGTLIHQAGTTHGANRSLSHCSGSPPIPGVSSSSLTNEVPKPPTRDAPPARPPYTPTLGGQAPPHSHQFQRTRKMFDKGPDQMAEDGEEAPGHRNFISVALQTGLCDWSAKYFAQPVMKVRVHRVQSLISMLRLSWEPITTGTKQRADCRSWIIGSWRYDFINNVDGEKETGRKRRRERDGESRSKEEGESGEAREGQIKKA
ncbi:hypothetical protein NFI96_027123, partial [Prochilodus magdalenae]